MAITAAQLVVKVNADTVNAEQGLAKIGTALGPAGPLMLGVGALAVAGVVIGGVAAKMAGDFQAGIITLATGAGESKKNLQLVSAGILQMAVDTGTSTKQLTDGMFMIESAGYHGAAGLDVLRAAAEGAKVGAADLGTVADGVTTVMVDYSKTHISAAQATNTLIAAVAQGKTHMQDLASSIATVLPAAAASRVGLNDVMGAMAQMTSEGVPAANAATFLRQTLLALDAPGGKAAKTLNEIGLTTEQVSGAMQQSLPGALAMIEEHIAAKFPASAEIMKAEMVKVNKGTENMDQALQNVASQGGAQYIEALKNIVGGAREIQGVLDLSGDHLQGFRDKVASISDAVKAGGNQIAGWDLVQGEFNQKMAILGEVVQTLMISLGTKLLPVLSQVATALAGGLTWAISHASTVLSIAGPIILGVAAAILSYLVPSLIAAAAAAIPLIATALVAAAPFLAIGAAVTALAFAVQYAYTHFKPFRDAVNEVLAAVKPLIAEGLQKAKEALGEMIPPIRQFASDMQTRLGPAINNIVTWIKAAFDFILPIWKAAWPSMLLILTGVWDMIKGSVQITWAIVSGIIKVGLDILGGNWKQAWTDMQNMFSGIWDGIKTMLQGAIEAMVGMVLNFVSTILGVLAKVPGPIGDMAQSALKAVNGVAAQMQQAGANAGGLFAGGLASAQSVVAASAQALATASVPRGTVRHFAGGTSSAPGGMAIVGEQGPELVNLPAGAQVLPASQTAAMRAGAGISGLPAGMSNGSGAGRIVVEIHNYTQLDGRMVAQSVAKHLPTVVRNATGARSF
jgi:TP901 family phage tail tape measure protein